MTTLEEQIRRLADAAAAVPRKQTSGRSDQGDSVSLRSVAVAVTTGLLIVAALLGVAARPVERDLDVATAPTGTSHDDEAYRVVTARLSLSGDEATVDVGSDDGIRPGVGVYRLQPTGDYREQGLVGVVDDAQATSSAVRLLGLDERLAVRSTVVYTDALASDLSGFSMIAGTVRTLGDDVVFTLDSPPSSDVARQIVGADVVVSGGPGSQLQAKIRIGTIQGPLSAGDSSSFTMAISDIRSGDEVRLFILAE